MLEILSRSSTNQVQSQRPRLRRTAVTLHTLCRIFGHEERHPYRVYGDSLRGVDSGINHCAQRTTKSPANNPQQTWWFEGEPPEAVIKDLRILVREIRLHEDELQLHLMQLPVRHLLISDIGTDHLLTPLDGRSEVASRPEFMAQKIAQPAFHIQRNSVGTLA